MTMQSHDKAPSSLRNNLTIAIFLVVVVWGISITTIFQRKLYSILVDAGIQTEQVNEILRLFTHMSTGFSLIGVAIAFIISFLIARAISNPVKQLTQYVRMFAFNKEKISLSIESNDEIGELAHSFQAMTQELEKSTHQLERTRDFSDSIVASLADGVIVTDADMNIVRVNKVTCSLLECAKREVLGKQIKQLFASDMNVDFQKIVNGIDEQILLIDRDLIIRFANNKFYETTGLPPEKVINKLCYEVTHNSSSICKEPDDICPIANSFNMERFATAVHTHYDKEGNGMNVQVITSPIINSAGEVLYYLHIERIMDDEHMSMLHVRSYAEQCNEYLQDIERRFLLTSEDISRLNRSGELLNKESVFRTLAGNTVFVNIAVRVLEEKHELKGSFIHGYVFVVRDMTDEKQLIQDLRRAKIEAEETNRSLEAVVEQRTRNLSRTQEATLNILEDLQEEKKAIDEIQKSLRLILDSLPVGVIIVNDRHIIEEANNAALHLFGETEKSGLVGQECHKFICLAEKGRCPVFDKAENLEQSECSFINKRGETISVIKSALPVILQGEKKLLEVIVDIRDRKRAEEAITWLASFPSQNPNPVVRIGKDGIVLYGNQAALPLLTLWRCACGQKLSGKWGDFVDNVFAAGTEEKIEVDCGDLKLLLTFSPIVEMNYLNVYASDITELKKAEEERMALEQDLNNSRKLEAIGTLAAGIAHEINTPVQFINDNVLFLSDSINDLLTLIESYRAILSESGLREDLESAIKKGESAEKGIDLSYLESEIPGAVEQTKEGISRVTKIVNAMKDFSHIGSEEKEFADINKAIDSTVTVSHNAWKYVADLDMELSPDLPFVSCYIHDINQTVMNLIVNASHAIADVIEKDGTRKGHIIVKTWQDDSDYIMISVSDTGSGIQEEARDKIFDPFFTTKKIGKGTGQGLSIAYATIVEKHKGKIWFTTEIGKGTTFFIQLPVSAN